MLKKASLLLLLAAYIPALVLTHMPPQKELCQTVCKLAKATTTNVPEKELPALCYLPKDTGPCKASMTSYYYNHKKGVCEIFVYGGCYGNNNRFGALDQCQRACKLTEDTLLRPRVDEDTMNVAEKELPGLCYLQKDSGPCILGFTSYYYNHMKGVCEAFVYGGCHGNNNRFWELKQCQRVCKVAEDTTTNVAEKELPDFCYLPKDSGPCIAYMHSYYYNHKKGVCEKFQYGSCEGNKNRFRTWSQCQIACKQPFSWTQNPACSLSKEKGTCKCRKTRYYFDPTAGYDGKCVKFIYSGCGGNDNRFYDKEDCLTSCPVLDRSG